MPVQLFFVILVHSQKLHWEMRSCLTMSGKCSITILAYKARCHEAACSSPSQSPPLIQKRKHKPCFCSLLLEPAQCRRRHPRLLPCCLIRKLKGTLWTTGPERKHGQIFLLSGSNLVISHWAFSLAQNTKPTLWKMPSFSWLHCCNGFSDTCKLISSLHK